MTGVSIKGLLGGAALAIVGAVALAPNAQAACWWNGYTWNCAMTPPTYAAPWAYGPRGGHTGDYSQIPNDYPGPALTGDHH